ncbi:MAG: MFS transporter [Vulcanibacillus sp.]
MNNTLDDNKKEVNKAPLWTRDFLITTLSNLFLFFSFQMLIPTLPAYTELAGGDAFAIGWVIGIYTISALISRPFVGKALDTYNQKVILFIGLSIFSLSVISYNWMNTVILILILRFIHGIGWGTTTTSLGAIISEIIPASRRGEGMGYYGLSSTFAMALAPLFGIWIMNTFGFSYLFLISLAMAITSLFLSQFISIPKNKPIKTGEKGLKLKDLYEKDALFPGLLILLLSITYGGIVTFITLYGKEVGIENVGWFFFGNAITVMLTRPIAGLIFDRKGHKWILIPGAFSASIGLIILSYSTDVYMLLLASFFYGLGFGSVQPSLLAWTINRVSPSKRGAANGTFFSAFDIGIGAGSIFLGTVARATSYSTMYRLSLILLLLYLLIYFRYLYRNRAKV